MVNIPPVSVMSTSINGSLVLEADNGWRTMAACRDTDPELFFPVGTTGLAIEQIDAAKGVCHQCEAQPDCLEFALITNQDSGVWGGKSEDERRKIRKRRRDEQRQAS